MAFKVSRAFKDISLSFKRHPVTNDLIMIKNENAIKTSVINLVRTYIGKDFSDLTLELQLVDHYLKFKSQNLESKLKIILHKL
jgi:hypothetical protein